MEVGAGKQLNCSRRMQSWNVTRLVHGEKFCNSSEQFGKCSRVPLLRQWRIETDEHVDGSRQGKDVTQIDVVVATVRSSVSQVQDLKGKPAGVTREGKDGNEVVQEASIFWPAGHLQGWWRWLPQRTARKLLARGRGNLQRLLCKHRDLRRLTQAPDRTSASERERARGPREQAGTTGVLIAALMWFVGWR